jgi:hypothetical protein
MTNEGQWLNEYRRAFEAVFLPQSPEEARSDLEDDLATERINELLVAAAGTDSGALLEKLEGLGLESDVLVMLTLYPLIAVAWADGRVDARERKVVLDAADRAGVTRGGLNHRLLEFWLSEIPNPALFDLWKRYARAVSDTMGRDWESKLAEQVLSLCQRVALASGGFLALDRIASSEYVVLRELKSAFD